MLSFNSELNNILQGMILAILIGMFYTLWATTRAYGGVIGSAVRMLGFGTILVAIMALEKMLINFEVVENSANMGLIQDVLTTLALFFLFMGFRKLASVVKT
jgi:hypothetical protein